MLHETGISVLQHFSAADPTLGKTTPIVLKAAEVGKKNVRPLPRFFTDMDEVELKKEDVFVPSIGEDISHLGKPENSTERLIQPGVQWLERVLSSLDKDLLHEDSISWGAYHASNHEAPSFRTKSHMLPIFTEAAHHPATVNHCMEKISETTEHLNPGQTPVMVVDLPLYTTAKRLQWSRPSSNIAEDKFIVMLGGMHIEKMLWTCVGDWLEGSGWITLIINSEIATPGSAQSMQKATHICRTR
jgi:hypothetical protein